MTTLATVLGIIPMSLGLEAGSEQYAPLARALLGGCADFRCGEYFPGAHGLFPDPPQREDQLREQGTADAAATPRLAADSS